MGRDSGIDFSSFPGNFPTLTDSALCLEVARVWRYVANAIWMQFQQHNET